VKQLFLVVIGVLIGLVVASRVGAPSRGATSRGATSGSATSGGGTFLARVDARAKAFTGAVADGYRSREAELRTDD
jgi:hypothetical protein